MYQHMLQTTFFDTKKNEESSLWAPTEKVIETIRSTIMSELEAGGFEFSQSDIVISWGPMDLVDDDGNVIASGIGIEKIMLKCRSKNENEEEILKQIIFSAINMLLIQIANQNIETRFSYSSINLDESAGNLLLIKSGVRFVVTVDVGKEINAETARIIEERLTGKEFDDPNFAVSDVLVFNKSFSVNCYAKQDMQTYKTVNYDYFVDWYTSDVNLKVYVAVLNAVDVMELFGAQYFETASVSAIIDNETLLVRRGERFKGIFEVEVKGQRLDEISKEEFLKQFESDRFRSEYGQLLNYVSVYDFKVIDENTIEIYFRVNDNIDYIYLPKRLTTTIGGWIGPLIVLAVGFVLGLLFTSITIKSGTFEKILEKSSEWLGVFAVIAVALVVLYVFRLIGGE